MTSDEELNLWMDMMTIKTQLDRFWTFKTLLYVVLLLLLPADPCAAAAGKDRLSMYLGEVKVLEMENIERVAIGNPGVASNSILNNGQLVILADSVGVTKMHIWFKNGRERDFEITVREKSDFDHYQELVHLLAPMVGVAVQKVGEVSVVRGDITQEDRNHYDQILARYPGVLDLVKTRDTTTDIGLLLQNIPGISVTEVGGSPVLNGEINAEYAQMIKVIMERYPEIVNLTRVRDVVADKMVYMQVRIMEMNRSVTEHLGINWNVIEGIAGPSFEFGTQTRSRASILDNSQQENIPGSLAAIGSSIRGASGYFGIATGLGSVINLYEGTGDAVVLAEPRLSTRSGGSAEFLAGGEYPVPTSNSLGATNVEFKKYGISLNVSPVVDDHNNIMARIETEISTIDDGNSVGEIPGVLTRRTNTDVSLKAGETMVIAGLVQDLASKDHNKVKWLGDVPVLGALFKSKKFQNKQTELVIFITPTIVDASSAINRQQMEISREIEKEFERIIEGANILD